MCYFKEHVPLCLLSCDASVGWQTSQRCSYNAIRTGKISQVGLAGDRESAVGLKPKSLRIGTTRVNITGQPECRFSFILFHFISPMYYADSEKSLMSDRNFCGVFLLETVVRQLIVSMTIMRSTL